MIQLMRSEYPGTMHFAGHSCHVHYMCMSQINVLLRNVNKNGCWLHARERVRQPRTRPRREVQAIGGRLCEGCGVLASVTVKVAMFEKIFFPTCRLKVNWES